MSESESPLPPRNAADVDFPYEQVEADHVSRREFAKFLCLVSGGMALGSGFVAIKDKIATEPSAATNSAVHIWPAPPIILPSMTTSNVPATTVSSMYGLARCCRDHLPGP